MDKRRARTLLRKQDSFSMNDNEASHGTRLLWNGFWNGFPSIFRMAVGFFLVPFILSHITTDLYGVWRLSFSILSASWMLQIGLNSAVNREVPQGIVRKDLQRISEVVSTTIGFYVILAAVISVGTGLLVLKFPQWFHVSAEHYTTSRLVIAITGIGFAVWVPFGVFRAVMNGLQSFAILGIVEILNTSLYALLVILFMKMECGVVVLTELSAARMILPVVAFGIIVKRSCPEIKILPRNVRYAVFRSILPYSFNSFTFSVANTLFISGSIWVTGALLGPTMTTYYSICAQLTGIIGGFLALTLVVAKPAASQFQARDDMVRVRMLFLRSIKYVFMLALPPVLFLCVFRKDVLMAWLGREDFVVAASSLIPILGVAQVAWLCQQANYYVINGIGRHRAIAVMAVCSTAMSVALAAVFVKTTSLGLVGIALGMTLPMSAVALFVVPVYSCKVLGISISEYVRRCFLESILPILLFFIFIVGWKKHAESLGLGELVLCLGIGVLIVFTGYWLLSLSESEKVVFKGLFVKVFGHFSRT